MNEAGDLAAGDFSPWLAEVRRAIRGEATADVPCGGCTACCTSSQFVHISPDETDTLAHIPPELLFPAPKRPRGHLLLGYDERGHCPMLVEGQCSIYEHRPRTCRTYDCRVFPATGLAPDDDDKALIAHQARRWRFGFPTSADQHSFDAARAAGTFLREHADDVLDGMGSPTTTQLAVLALELHDLFVRGDDPAGTPVAAPDPRTVRVELARRTGARAGR